MSKKMSFLDKTFWITESVNNPKHVAGLQLMEAPEGAEKHYVENLFNEMKTFDKAMAPLDSRVVGIGRWPIKFKSVDKLDMSYHLQLHHIENIEDQSALNTFACELHEQILDRNKPLWQVHLITDGTSRKFATYVKVHHVYGDGATIIRWLVSSYSDKPITEGFTPIWAAERPNRAPRRKPSILKRIVLGVLGSLVIFADLLFIFLRLLMKMTFINSHYMPIPFTGKKTVLTGQVKKGRKFAILNLDFKKIKHLSKTLRASPNELLLCAFDIGVHRFLKDYGHSFDKALITNMPINLRKPGEHKAGNNIAIVPVKLGYGTTDPYLRLRQILENHQIVLREARRAHPLAFINYTIIIQSFALLYEMLHLSNIVRPIGNILVSNVPGPRTAYYLRDAKMLGIYPMSTMTPGGGVNITLLSYNGLANIGFVCCSDKIDSLEPMAAYCNEAFDMLERSVQDYSVNIKDIGEEEWDQVVHQHQEKPSDTELKEELAEEHYQI